MINIENYRRASLRIIPALLSFAILSGCAGPAEDGTELLNASNDPTRELWRDINAAFIPRHEKETGKRLTIKQSHGPSASQARAILDGLDADVATLGLWSDTDVLRKRGSLDPDWEARLPHRSLPFFSTIVFVVRKGNPKGIKDWPDLIQPGVAIITPNPKTSGNGKLSFLAAWGAVLQQGGNESAARDLVTKLYQQTPVLDSGSRGATTTFAQNKIGDVHLTWENEARWEVAEAKGELEVVYPSVSLRAEPPVAVVDANVRRRGTQAAAEAYMRFLFTEEGQEIFAKHYCRPSEEKILKKHAERFPEIKLFTIAQVAKDWDEAQVKFFGDGGVFENIYRPRAQ